MTPKERAIELVNKFKNASFNCTDCDMPYCDVHCTKLNTNEAKECALIAVDYIIDAVPISQYDDNRLDWVENEVLIFWEQVKEEIEKL